ncbi:hypothetical protein [Paracoccus sanguinis]|uniref:hypothetical protein n=1 Tax=Paracoccus sanguinis TaxID=1545044 RepID=UPI000A74257E|nr:hypothetical protein [Paracoccus sanguinis]
MFDEFHFGAWRVSASELFEGEQECIEREEKSSGRSQTVDQPVADLQEPLDPDTEFDTKSITLSCGRLTTGITIRQWSSLLMLRNLKSPKAYFQAAFRVQSPWSIKNPNGDDPNAEEVLKPVCFVFEFAPTRALRQLSE